MNPSGLLRFIVGLSLAFPPQTAELRAQQPSGVRELDEAKALYREARLAECVTRLDAAIEKLRGLPPSDSRKRDLADAHLLLGLSKLALNERAAAKAALEEVVRLDPERRLDPEVYAPKVVELFEEARLQAQSRAADAAVPPPSLRATPAPSPDRGKKGSKLPLILLGVGGVGGGIVVLAGGGSSAAPVPSPTPTPDFTRYYGTYFPITWAVAPESARGCSNIIAASITLSGNPDGSNFMFAFAANTPGAGMILSDGRFQSVTGAGGIFSVIGQTDGTGISGRMISTACVWSFDGTR